MHCVSFVWRSYMMEINCSRNNRHFDVHIFITGSLFNYAFV